MKFISDKGKSILNVVHDPSVVYYALKLGTNYAFHLVRFGAARAYDLAERKLLIPLVDLLKIDAVPNEPIQQQNSEQINFNTSLEERL